MQERDAQDEAQIASLRLELDMLRNDSASDLLSDILYRVEQDEARHAAFGVSVHQHRRRVAVVIGLGVNLVNFFIEALGRRGVKSLLSDRLGGVGVLIAYKRQAKVGMVQ